MLNPNHLSALLQSLGRGSSADGEKPDKLMSAILAGVHGYCVKHSLVTRGEGVWDRGRREWLQTLKPHAREQHQKLYGFLNPFTV